MPRRAPDPPDPSALAAARAAVVAAASPAPGDLRLLTRHYLRLLEERAPGRSVEVRVPPWGAVQAVAGPRHTRGTPAAVVEMPPETWVALALGALTWSDALAGGGVTASGERADLAPYLPLDQPLDQPRRDA